MDAAWQTAGTISATVIRTTGMHQLKTIFTFAIVVLLSNMDFQTFSVAPLSEDIIVTP